MTKGDGMNPVTVLREMMNEMGALVRLVSGRVHDCLRSSCGGEGV